MDLSKIDLDALLAKAEQALSFAETAAAIAKEVGLPGAALGDDALRVAKFTVSALQRLRDDVSLESAVLGAQTQAALDALQPRLDALTADTEKRLDET